VHKAYRLVMLGLALIMPTACGFKLRGQAQLPPELARTYIHDNRTAGALPSDLALSLKRALEVNGVVLVTEPEPTAATLAILRAENRRRTIAAGSAGQSREYELRFIVEYEVTLPDKSVLIPRETMAVSRDALYDEARVLGRAAGEELLIKDMVNDVTYSIIRRLQAVAQRGS